MRSRLSPFLLTFVATNVLAGKLLYAVDNVVGGQIQLWDTACSFKINGIKGARELRITRAGRATSKGCWYRHGETVRTFEETMSGVRESVTHNASEFVKQ